MADTESGELTLSELLACAAMVECSLCGEVYREPVLLPCLHSFCVDCLVDVMLRDGQAKAPPGHENRKSEKLKAPASDLCLSKDEPNPGGGEEEDGGVDEINGRVNGCLGIGNNEEASVRLILRELEGKRPGPGDRDAPRPRRLRPLSSKPHTAAVSGGSSQSQPPKTQYDSAQPRQPEVQFGSLQLVQSRASCSSVEYEVSRSRTAPAIASTADTAGSATDNNTSERLLLSRQKRGLGLSLVCPTCGRAVELAGDVLLQDDAVEDGDKANDGDGDFDRDMQIRRTAEVRPGTSTSKTEAEVKRGKRGTTISNHKPMTTRKLRTLLRKTISASVLPNHFLNSLAEIHRHKNPCAENAQENKRKNSENNARAKGEGLHCAYCLTEGQNVDAASLCLDCNDRMCEDCVCAHRKTRVTRNHMVAPLSSIRQGLFDHDLRSRDHVTCEVHQGVPITLFCCDCIASVCKRCKADKHRSHKVMPLQEISTKLVPELRQIQKAIGRRVPALAEYRLFLEEQESRLRNKKQLVAQEICDQAQLVHKMVDEHKQKLLDLLDQACAEQSSDISAKMRTTSTARDSLSQVSAFLLHLGRLGRADEIVTSYSSIVDFYRHLVNTTTRSTGQDGDPSNGQAADGKPATPAGSRDQLDTGDTETVDRTTAGAESPALTTRLACVFTAGPCTETNIGILLGPLDLHKVPLNAKDNPRSMLPLTSLMPDRLQCPAVQSTFHAGVSSDRCPAYPSGLALHPRIIALVDRENASVKIFDKTSGNFLRTIRGDGRSSLAKPFDVIFLDKTGTTLAVSDSEAGVVRVFESMTGKFLRDFAGEVRHPRGLAVMPGTGQIVVVDGHLRHFTFHDPNTGEMVRRVRPTHTANHSLAGVGCADNFGGRQSNPDNDNDRQRTSGKGTGQTHTPHTSKHDEDERFKSTALIDPYYIAWTMSGHLVVTDQASPNLKIVDAHTGDILSQSMDYGTGQEESLHPSGLCVDRYGQIFISDTNNSRVHIALPNGMLTGAVLLQDKRKTKLAAKTGLTMGGRMPSGDCSEEVDKSQPLETFNSDLENTGPSVSKPLCLAIDDETGHLVVAQAGGHVKVIKYM